VAYQKSRKARSKLADCCQSSLRTWKIDSKYSKKQAILTGGALLSEIDLDILKVLFLSRYDQLHILRSLQSHAVKLHE
jgi:hypothetical protein